MKKKSSISQIKETLLGIAILPVIIYGMAKASLREDDNEEVIPKKIFKKSSKLNAGQSQHSLQR